MLDVAEGLVQRQYFALPEPHGHDGSRYGEAEIWQQLRAGLAHVPGVLDAYPVSEQLERHVPPFEVQVSVVAEVVPRHTP